MIFTAKEEDEGVKSDRRPPRPSFGLKDLVIAKVKRATCFLFCLISPENLITVFSKLFGLFSLT